MARVRELPLPPGTALMVGSSPPEAAGAHDLDAASFARREWNYRLAGGILLYTPYPGGAGSMNSGECCPFQGSTLSERMAAPLWADSSVR